MYTIYLTIFGHVKDDGINVNHPLVIAKHQQFNCLTGGWFPHSFWSGAEVACRKPARIQGISGDITKSNALLLR